MNTRNRPGHSSNLFSNRPPSPFGLGTAAGALQGRQQVSEALSMPHLNMHTPSMAGAAQPNPACTIENGRLCRHPLTNQ